MHAYAASVPTIKGLYFMRPRSRTTAYVGAGAGWGAVSFGRSFEIPNEFRSPSTPDIDEQWHGQGLEGNNAFDVYRRKAGSASRSSPITITPQIAPARKGVLVSVRF